MVHETEPTVFVVDDDEPSCEAVAAIVESMGIASRMFSSAEDFLNSYDPSMRGCVVSDVRMIGISGLDLLERLNSSSYSIPVILMTAYADVPLAVRGMKQGAVTLLEKPCRSNDMWDAIHAALKVEADRRKQQQVVQTVEKRIDSLTPSELAVVNRIAEGIPIKNIALELDMSVRTVETRRARAFEKLRVDSIPQLVRLMLEVERASGLP